MLQTLYAATLLAQGDGGAQPPAPSGAPPIMSMLPMLIAGGLFVFLMFSSSRKQKQAQLNLLANMKKNDKVETASGIFGTIVTIKDGEDEVTLRTDDSTNSRVRVRKTSISRIIGEDDGKASEGKS